MLGFLPAFVNSPLQQKLPHLPVGFQTLKERIKMFKANDMKIKFFLML